MGFFGRQKNDDPPHPRPDPRVDLPLTVESVKQVFSDCVDFATREVNLAGDANKRVTVCYVGGMVKLERVNDYLLRPMAQDEQLRTVNLSAAYRLMSAGALYNLVVFERGGMDDAVNDMIAGNLLMFFPGEEKVLSFMVGTEEKRSIMPPTNETSIKGSRDSFVESLRTNTSLVRRHIKAPELKIREQVVGRQSLTQVDILYIEGITDMALVEQVEGRIQEMDIDALLSTGNIEEYIVDTVNTAFPMVHYTERPDRFCGGLTEGRVGILIDGLPLGYLAPGTVGQFLRAPQDKSNNWILATAISVLRYLCLFATLLLPAFYIAVVSFHQEMIPTRLALSIIAAKQNVPFTTVFEVLLLLVAFEILQEAGLRLPPSIGQTVSIIGGLVVGSAAVEAKIISPAVLIVVAAAGIAGYTMPSQEFAGALRIWRFVLAVAASVAGLFGMVMGAAVLILHLGRLESFGVAYLTPFAANDGDQVQGHAVLRQPLTKVKYRQTALHTKNRRKQR